MKIVVIGGTGLIGRSSSRSCATPATRRWRRRPTRASTRSPARGSPDALEGAQVVVDVANAPNWDDAAVMDFFQTSSLNIASAETAAGVSHHVVLSVVGADRLAESGYYAGEGRPGGDGGRRASAVHDPPRVAVLRVHRPHCRFEHERRERVICRPCSSNRNRPTTSPRHWPMSQ